MERDNLKEMLTRHEGLRLKPYKCSAGKLTIGYGRNLEDNGISPSEALEMLENDIEEVDLQVRREFPWFNSLDPARQDVVLNMVFNLGITRFKAFRRTIKFISEGKYDKASKEMLLSIWASQVGPRAVELSEIMRDGK